MRTVAAILTVLLAAMVADPAAAQLVGGTRAEGCAAAVGGAVSDSVVNVICGLDVEEVEALLRLVLDEESARARARDDGQLAALEELKTLEAETHRRLEDIAAGVDPLTTEAIRRFFEILGESAAPREELRDRLAEIAARHVGMLDRLALLDPDDPAVSALVERAREHIRLGRYEDADAALARAEAIERTELAKAQSLVDEVQSALRQRQLNHGATIAERAQLAEARLRHADAGRIWQEAASAVPEDAPERRYTYLMSAAVALDRHTEVSGDAAGVDRAIALFDGQVMPLARQIGDLRLWAGAAINFGNALQTRGIRDPDPRWLRSAISAYEAALSVFTPDDFPRDWALAQGNLGTSMHLVGQRSGNMKNFLAARRAHELALEVFTREAMKRDVARTLINLAQVERNIGQRTGDLETLERSVARAREAASIQDELDEQSARLSALEDMARSLEALGDLLDGDERLEEAVAVLETVAGGRDPRLEPVDFASAQRGLGDALLTLGQRRLGRETERDQGRSDLEAALEAYDAAIAVTDRAEQTVGWAALRQNAGNAQVILGRRYDDAEALAAARAAYQDALTVFTRDRFPLEWANTTKNLGMVLFSEAALEEDSDRHRRALDLLALSLEELTLDKYPLEYAGTRLNMGIIRKSLGELMQDGEVLAASRQDVLAAQDVFRDAGADFWVSNGARMLEDIGASEEAIASE